MSPLAHILRGFVFAYRFTLSPLIGQGCRFRPTCSEYAIDAITLHGALAGGALTVRRVCRCRPGGGSGFDPVPRPEAVPSTASSRTKFR